MSHLLGQFYYLTMSLSWTETGHHAISLIYMEYSDPTRGTVNNDPHFLNVTIMKRWFHWFTHVTLNPFTAQMFWRKHVETLRMETRMWNGLCIYLCPKYFMKGWWIENFKFVSLKTTWRMEPCPWYGIIYRDHWGRVTHTCVSKLTIIGSGDGLSPGRRQAIIWTNAGILLIRTLGTNFSAFRAFSFKKMHLKMSSAKWHPLCLSLNVLTNMCIVSILARVPWLCLLPLRWTCTCFWR